MRPFESHTDAQSMTIRLTSLLGAVPLHNPGTSRLKCGTASEAQRVKKRIAICRDLLVNEDPPG